jgi:hypothetical protein
VTTRLAVRVKPRAGRDRVGGTWGSDEVLVVATAAPPVDGRANAAVLALLAEALGVRRRQVTIVGGHRGRDKLVEVDEPPPDLDDRLRRLRAG